MNKKFGMNKDGKKIISIFIGVIMALVLLSVAANEIYVSSNTVSETNVSITTGLTNVSKSIDGRNLVGNWYIWNGSDVNVGVQGNVTLQDETINGAQTITIKVNQNGTDYASEAMKVVYAYEPDGYVRESGTRGIMLLILITSALAIVVFIVMGLLNKGPLSKLLGDKK